jgi:hypothetical protein
VDASHDPQCHPARALLNAACVNRTIALTLFCLIAIALPLLAQPADSDTPRLWRSELELQAYRFGNFFQAREGQPEESINGYGAEYRVAYRPHPDAPDFYANLNVLNYAGDNGQTGYGGRIGVAHYGSVHSYNAYLDRQENGFAFDVGDRTAAATVTSAGGNYGYRFVKNWQAGVDGYFEKQRFDIETGFENDYKSIGAQIRYRGFGQKFQPRFGIGTGNRDVRDDAESYDERYWYVQVNSVPLPRLNGSLRFRSRTRDYDVGTREDERNQWRLTAQFKQNARIAWTGTYTRESVDDNRPGRDFDTNTLMAGIIIGF